LGTGIHDAYYTLEKVEQFAQVVLVARQLGGVAALSRADVAKLAASRARDPNVLNACLKCGSCAEGAADTPDDDAVREAVLRVLARLNLSPPRA
jgi:hypothetical protein